jgi:hypothetical protein
MSAHWPQEAVVEPVVGTVLNGLNRKCGGAEKFNIGSMQGGAWAFGDWGLKKILLTRTIIWVGLAISCKMAKLAACIAHTSVICCGSSELLPDFTSASTVTLHGYKILRLLHQRGMWSIGRQACSWLSSHLHTGLGYTSCWCLVLLNWALLVSNFGLILFFSPSSVGWIIDFDSSSRFCPTVSRLGRTYSSRLRLISLCSSRHIAKVYLFS